MKHYADQAATIRAMGAVVLDLMARVRALEAKATSRKITAKSGHIPAPRSAIIRNSILQLVTDAAALAGITETDILGSGQARKFSWPRQWVMLEAYSLGFSPTQISVILNKHPKTVSDGIKSEQKRRGEA